MALLALQKVVQVLFLALEKVIEAPFLALPGGPEGVSSVCGAMTSGGTESILTAVKATRDYARSVRGIRDPEMLIADSAHAAFFKAAEYFKIKLIKVLAFSG